MKLGSLNRARFLFLGYSALLYGCGLGGRSENIKPGEADYPVENPNPKQVLQIAATIPTSLPVHFIIAYAASTTGGTMQSGTACAYTDGVEPRRYSVVPSLNLTRVGDTYHGTIALDRYQPGRCQWAFAGAWYIVDTEGPDETELFIYDQGTDHPGDNRLDIWCIKSVRRSRALPEACLGIHALQPQFPESISLAMLHAAIEKGFDKDPPTHVGVNARSIVIEFHDMDADVDERSNRQN
jgi:hypothetical protein